jgi:LAO/AO transport system kinase
VLTCSARTKAGIGEVWNTVLEYAAFTQNNNYFDKKRMEQSRYWMYETINQQLQDSFYSDQRILKMLEREEARVLSGETTPFTPARALLDKYFTRRWLKFHPRR